MENPIWPSSSLTAIVPSDTTTFTPALRQVYIGGTGDVVVETDAGQVITFKAVPTGATLGPFFIRKIKAATSATFIVGFA